MESESVENPPPKPNREEEILELAKKELLREIKCASMRAEQFGAHSWAKPQKYIPSKRFLKHMIVNDSRYNDRKEQRYLERREENRSRHSSSYVRHREYPSERYKRHEKKRERSSEDGNELFHYESKKHQYREKRHRKNSPFELEESKISLEEDRNVKVDKKFLLFEKGEQSRKKASKRYSPISIDEKRVVSDKEDDHIEKRQDKSGKKKHSKSFQLMDELIASHYENGKVMLSEEENNSNQEKQRKKHSKKKKSKWQE